MLFIFIPLTTMSAILIFTDYKNPSTRWGSAFLFFSGIGDLGMVILTSVIPNIEVGIWKTVLTVTCCVLFSIAYQWSPYAFLMYSLKYSGLFRKYQHFDNISKYIFFIPVVLMYFTTDVYPHYTPNFVCLSLWVIPYNLASNFFLIYSAVKEKNWKIKRQRIFTCAVLIPPALYCVISAYVLRIFGINNLWQFNFLFILIGFTVFIASAATYGVMGVKIKSEQTRIESTIKAISSGTAILNHTLKNEIMKISLCTSNIRDSINSNIINKKDANENIDVVGESITYLTSFIQRINEQIGEIKLKEEECDLAQIVKRSLDAVVPYKKDANIHFVANYDYGILLKCDSLHIQECLRNILKNAIEAMSSGGTLMLQLFETKKHFAIFITDTGCGIPKQNLPHIFEPFFTTKTRSMNFGLGLSYCYSVLKKHQGNLEIQSDENKGTKVLLSLPKSRIIKYTVRLPQRSQINE